MWDTNAWDANAWDANSWEGCAAAGSSGSGGASLRARRRRFNWYVLVPFLIQLVGLHGK